MRPGFWHPTPAHFEDGTVNFLNLPAVEIGLRFLDRIGIETIHTRVETLGSALIDTLDSLRHTDGSPAAVVYGPRDFDRRGATVAFNFLRPDGQVVDERYVDRVARRLRCGPAASAIPTPARSPLPLRAKRWWAASSARA